MNVSMHWAVCLLKGIYTLGSLRSEWDLSIGQSALESIHALGSLHFECMCALALFAVCLLNTSGQQAVSILNVLCSGHWLPFFISFGVLDSVHL